MKRHDQEELDARRDDPQLAEQLEQLTVETAGPLSVGLRPTIPSPLSLAAEHVATVSMGAVYRSGTGPPRRFSPLVMDTSPQSI